MGRIAYKEVLVSALQAEKISVESFGVSGKATALPGEIDVNFKITSPGKSFTLKISRPGTDENVIDLQDKLLEFIERKAPSFLFPKIVKSCSGERVVNYTDVNNMGRKVRMLEWIEGRLYASVHPRSDALRYSLGKKCGEITACLQSFKHPAAERNFDWDIASAAWTENYLHLFSGEERNILSRFQEQFQSIGKTYSGLRKSVIHNDANDHNIIVSPDPVNPLVLTVIDYGDAVYSQVINDLAVTLAYGIMDTENPLLAAIPIVRGYNESFPIRENEMEVLYTAVAMRLVISVTKSAINKSVEPGNEYLQVSERQAWDVLKKWNCIPGKFAAYSFRMACGYPVHPTLEVFKNFVSSNPRSISDLFPSVKGYNVQPIDFSVSSPWMGNFRDYQDTDVLIRKTNRMILETKNTLWAGGYGEHRAFYTTDAYRKKINEGFENRTIHLGVDFWVKAGTHVHSVFPGELFSFYNNDNPKDYGPTIIIKHNLEGLEFFTLYGHLSVSSLSGLKQGKIIKQGEKIAEIGDMHENGEWAPHLHFQVILDMLDCTTDFYGVSTPSEWPVYSGICPDPNLFFNEPVLVKKENITKEEQLTYRRNHLGKSLSLSYSSPLMIVRGQMQYLLDEQGQRYLDTVNNVAHVGHEHPVIVKAGQEQMAVLNTNTRYLHDHILEYVRELLSTFPDELCVVHFVNSGSEANELALRMAKAFSKQRDVIALESGYHGNTQACIDVSSYKFDGKGGEGAPEHTHIVPLPDAFRGKYRGDDCGLLYAQHVKELLENINKNGRNISAFIAENIVSCGGQVVLPEGFLKESYASVKTAGGVCIADEVQTGFGRVGKHFWAFQLHGVVPDIVTIGKPAGNGHPLSAVVCTQKIANAFANGMEYFNTFGGNPVSCAIGRKVLEVIRDEKLRENALKVGEFLKHELKTLGKIFPLIGDVRGEGLFLGVELVEPGKVPAPGKTEYLVNRMKDYKILMSVDGPQHNVIKIKPPLCFSLRDAEFLLDSFGKVLNENYLEAISKSCIA